MILEDIMKQDIVTLSPNNTIEDAITLLTLHKIRHIPIVDDNKKILGIISDRDIRDASPSILIHNEQSDYLKTQLTKIMTRNVITGSPLDFVEEAAAIFYEYKISCLPVERQGKLIGIVTETDLLHTLVQLTGAHQPSSHIEVKVPNRTGMLAEVVNIIKKRNVNITSILVYPDKDENYKILVFRVQTMNPTGLIADLKASGKIIKFPDIPGATHEL